MKGKFVPKCKFEIDDEVIVVKPHLSYGGYKIQSRRTGIVKSIEEFGGDFTLTIKLDDDGVFAIIPEDKVEKTK